MTGEQGSCPVLEWCATGRPFPGHDVSGDRAAVFPFPSGVLVAMIDGLGHGPEAATAAEAALTSLARHAPGPLPTLLGRCDDDLRRTRGAAVSLAWVDATGRLDWLGVGNVEGVLVRANQDGDANPSRQALPLRPGVVGMPHARRPVLASCALAAGDVVVLATDGLRSGFAGDVDASSPPARLADRLLSRYGRDTDDATVLVARFLGPSP